MQRLGRYGLRIAQNIRNTPNFSSDTKDEATRLASNALKSANSVSPGTEEIKPKAFQVTQVKLPRSYTSITAEEFEKTAVKIDALSKKAIIEKGVPQKMQQSVETLSNKLPPYLTGSFYSWIKSSHEKVNIQKDGSIILLNSDKRFLINQFASLVERGVIVPEKQILLLNEGCDNGDFLGLMIPYLSDCGSELKIILVNGNEKKLQEAARFSKSLLQDQDVEYVLHDSFSSIPGIVNKFSDHQTFHLFFRLPIVERFDIVADFTEKRLASMKPNDIAIGSFLLWNDVSIKAMIKYGNKPKEENPESGYITLEQELTKSAKKTLVASGTQPEDLNGYVTAFTEKGVCDLITDRGGEILQMSVIPTQTDQKQNIEVVGVIFKKRPN